MGYLHYRQSFRLGSGFRVNLSKSGVSASFGGKGATVNVGPKGVRTTLRAPGSGISYVHRSGWGLGGTRKKRR